MESALPVVDISVGEMTGWENYCQSGLKLGVGMRAGGGGGGGGGGDEVGGIIHFRRVLSGQSSCLSTENKVDSQKWLRVYVEQEQ